MKVFVVEIYNDEFEEWSTFGVYTTMQIAMDDCFAESERGKLGVLRFEKDVDGQWAQGLVGPATFFNIRTFEVITEASHARTRKQ